MCNENQGVTTSWKWRKESSLEKRPKKLWKQYDSRVTEAIFLLGVTWFCQTSVLFVSLIWTEGLLWYQDYSCIGKVWWISHFRDSFCAFTGWPRPNIGMLLPVKTKLMFPNLIYYKNMPRDWIGTEIQIWKV